MPSAGPKGAVPLWKPHLRPNASVDPARPSAGPCRWRFAPPSGIRRCASATCAGFATFGQPPLPSRLRRLRPVPSASMTAGLRAWSQPRPAPFMRGRRGGAGGGDALYTSPASVRSDCRSGRTCVGFAILRTSTPCEAACGVCLHDPPQPCGGGRIVQASGPVAGFCGPVSMTQRCRIIGSAISASSRLRRMGRPDSLTIHIRHHSYRLRSRPRAGRSPFQRRPKRTASPPSPLVAREARAGGRPGRWNLRAALTVRQPRSASAPITARHPGRDW